MKREEQREIIDEYFAWNSGFQMTVGSCAICTIEVEYRIIHVLIVFIQIRFQYSTIITAKDIFGQGLRE
ncbi:MAG: hypothetical protein NC489_08995 [Ruminococcus flavefaciens]|nr:hypothetical protein [Ruminococcus flavefaciens]